MSGIKIRLEDTKVRKYDVAYRIHEINGDWSDCFKNGQEAFGDNQHSFDAIEISINDRGVGSFAEIGAEKVIDFNDNWLCVRSYVKQKNMK